MRNIEKIFIVFLLCMITGCSGKVRNESGILEDINSSDLLPSFVEFSSVDIEKRQTNKKGKEDIVVCELEGMTDYAKHTYEAELLYKYWDKGGWILEEAEYELTSIEVTKEPKKQSDPMMNLQSIPYDYANTRWIDGEISVGEFYTTYKENYSFFLQKDDAVIPYWAEGELTQIYEYNPYSGEWIMNNFYTDNVYQQIFMGAYPYRWIGTKSGGEEIFDIVDGPNSFSHRYKNFFGTNSLDKIEIDILAGGYNIKNKRGEDSLPGSGWCAKATLDMTSFPNQINTFHEAIDLVNGRLGLNSQIYEIPEEQIEEAKYNWKTIETEERDQLFKTLGELVFGEGISAEWIKDGSRMVCNRKLMDQEFGNVEIQMVWAVRGEDKSKMGYGIYVISNDGYGGKIGVVVGINNEGVIENVEITELMETVGLGTNVREPAFKSQYSGKSNTLTVITSGTAGQDEIEAISGATITSKAVTNAVNAALFYNECFLKEDKS